MAVWVCEKCGHKVEARCKPGKCSKCGAKKEDFKAEKPKGKGVVCK